MASAFILHYFLQTPGGMKLTVLFQNFFKSKKAGGLILVFVTALSLLLANSVVGPAYQNLWHYRAGGHTIVHLINDGLMTVFFLLIGLELEREFYIGELSEVKNAVLPVFGALGGMVVPAAIFLAFNFDTGTRAGAGIPTATDIAFALGILSLLGSRVPGPLKVFLAALAVIDDLGAIIIIAIFYTSSVSLINLGIALAIFGALGILNRLKVHYLLPYLLGGIAMWYFMLHSGVHATITGVLLAFAIPFGNGSQKSPSYILQQFLHKPVAFIILPLFAMANTSISIGSNWAGRLSEPYSMGIMAGLVIGKPMGILLFSFISAALSLGTLPAGINWKNIAGAGFLGGIGFTMSIFITLLAFDDGQVINNSKIAILLGSLISAIAGYIFLKLSLKREA